MALAIELLPSESAQQLTAVCRWYRLGDMFTASQLNPYDEFGRLEAAGIQWQLGLRTLHAMSMSRTLSLHSTDASHVLKFRSRAYLEPLTSDIPADRLVQQNSAERPTLGWVDCYPNLHRLRAIHKTAGHIVVQSGSLEKEQPGPEVMAIESAQAITIQHAKDWISVVGAALLATLPAVPHYQPEVGTNIRPC